MERGAEANAILLDRIPHIHVGNAAHANHPRFPYFTVEDCPSLQLRLKVTRHVEGNRRLLRETALGVAVFMMDLS